MAEMRGKVCIVASLVAVWASEPSLADYLTGSPRVIDGDTIAVGSRHVRLQGIDAPETDQVCLDAQGERWTCGITARERLSAHIAGRAVRFASRGEDRYGRMLATCSADGENLNAWMVREGWVLAYVQYSHEYLGEEAAARTQRTGMWAGAFIAPWDWRHRDKRTAILGAVSVPVAAQAKLLAPASSATAPSPGMYHQGQRQPARRAHLSPTRTTDVCDDQYGGPAKAVVLLTMHGRLVGGQRSANSFGASIVTQVQGR